MPPPQRVLIVEDDDDIRGLLVSFLTGEGYTVRGAAHGAEALDVLRRWTCDVVVTDLDMPVMDGRDLLARLRSVADWRTIRIIVATSDHQVTQQAPRLDADHVLLKPFDVGALTELLGRLGEVRPPTALRSSG